MDENKKEVYSDEYLTLFLKDKFNIASNIHRGNKVYILKESCDKFQRLIEPYIQEDLKYKLKRPE